MDVLIGHLVRSPPSSLDFDRFDAAYVLEAPEAFVNIIERRVSVRECRGTWRSFRAQYYRTIEVLLRPEQTDWMRPLDPAAANLLEAAALPVASYTWKDADLLHFLDQLDDSPNSVHVITDNDEGIGHWHVLRKVGRALGVDRVDLSDLRQTRGLGRRATNCLDRVAADWERPLRQIRDSLITQDRRIQTTEPVAFFYADSPRIWEHLAPICRVSASVGLRPVAMATNAPQVRRLRRSGADVHACGGRGIPRSLYAATLGAIASLPIKTEELEPPASPAYARAIRIALAMRLRDRLSAMHRGIRLVRAAARVAPDSCFVHAGEMHPVANAITLEARRHGLPTVLLAHGLIDYLAPELAYYPPVDLFVAWGDLMRDGLRSSDLPPGIEVRALGSPHLEEKLSQGPRRSRSGTILTVFGRTSRVVTRSRFEASANEVISAAIRCPDQEFVLKPHPSDTSAFWDEMLRTSQLSNVRLERQRSFYDLLQDAWLVLTMHSTAGAEALCADVPVISIDIDLASTDAVRDPDYVSAGAAYIVDQSDELAPLIQTLKGSPIGRDPLAAKRREFGAAFLTGSPGPAAKRIAEQVSRLAGTRTTPRSELPRGDGA